MRNVIFFWQIYTHFEFQKSWDRNKTRLEKLCEVRETHDETSHNEFNWQQVSIMIGYKISESFQSKDGVSFITL